MTDIMEARRKWFEEWMAAGAGVELRKVVAARSGDGGYALKEINIAWDGWNAALDSVCVELPQPFEGDDFTMYDGKEIVEAIERAGLKVKP